MKHWQEKPNLPKRKPRMDIHHLAIIPCPEGPVTGGFFEAKQNRFLTIRHGDWWMKVGTIDYRQRGPDVEFPAQEEVSTLTRSFADIQRPQ